MNITDKTPEQKDASQLSRVVRSLRAKKKSVILTKADSVLIEKYIKLCVEFGEMPIDADEDEIIETIKNHFSHIHNFSESFQNIIEAYDYGEYTHGTL